MLKREVRDVEGGPAFAEATAGKRGRSGLFEKRAWESALTDDPAQGATVDFAMKGHGKRDRAASHHDMTAALSHSLKTVFDK